MAKIKMRDTAPELILRQALWAAGLRYRLKASRRLPGKPDLIFPGAKVAVFVDGCFWHSCPEHGHIPKSREAYWRPKLQRTQERDMTVVANLSALGWHVLRLWEHQITKDLAECISKISAAVRQS